MADGLPIGLQLSKVHKFLAKELEAYSSQDIKNRTGVDIENTPEILHSLTGDASKVIRDKQGRWRWASKYQLTNFNHLITLIARSLDGVNERDLYDSYRGVRDDIKKLKAKNAVHELKIGSKVILFPKNQQLTLDITDELKLKYKTITLPEDEIETHRYLVEHGLKQTDDKNGIKIAQPIVRKRPNRRNDRKRQNKRIKLTNTHLKNSDIDLTKEYKSAKDSAFS